MENSYNKTVRGGASVNYTFSPLTGRSSEGVTTTPTSMDTVIAMLRRLEAKFDDNDGRGSNSQTMPRPEPDPPYDMPPNLKSPAWVPGGLPVVGTDPRGVLPSTHVPSASMQVGPNFRVPSEGQQQLGFLPFQHVPSHQPSSWDIGPPRSSWDHPLQRVHSSPHGTDPMRLLKMEPPIFDRADANNWVTRIQYYFDHIMLPEEQRLHYVVMLFAPTVSDWIFSYRANNPMVSWRQFLDDVRRWFDLNYFVNYIELISKLTQTGSLGDYNREFEKMMNQIQVVSESTLLSIYLGGLRQPVRNQVRFQHPTSVSSPMALAMEFDVTSDRGSTHRR